jgi:hypothetical protein
MKGDLLCFFSGTTTISSSSSSMASSTVAVLMIVWYCTEALQVAGLIAAESEGGGREGERRERGRGCNAHVSGVH